MSARSVFSGQLPTARLQRVGLSYAKTVALDDVTLDLPSGCIAGLIGPDGVGKSGLLSLVAGARGPPRTDASRCSVATSQTHDIANPPTR